MTQTTQKQAIDNSILGQLGLLIDEVAAAGTKQAADDGSGSGSAKKDPGGYTGASSHPSAKADAGVQAAPVGSRGKENEEDVRKDVPNNTNAASDASEESDYNQVQIGVKKAPTGEDSSVEDAYKGTKQDPGTTHPANAEEIGEKYASLSFDALYKAGCDKMNELMSRIANGEQLKAASAPGTPAVGQESQDAAAAGYAMAALAAGSQTKQAAAIELLADMQKEAFADADMVGELLTKLQQRDAMFKQAEGGPPMPPPEALPPEMGGGASPMGGGAGGAAGGMPPEMAGGAGGMPPEMAGGMGAPAGGGMGGGEMGGGDVEGAVNEFVNAMLDAGITPDALLEQVQNAVSAGQSGAGAEGGAPGGAPPDGNGAADAAAAGGGEKTSSLKLPMSELAQLWKAASNGRDLLDGNRFRRVKLRVGSKEAAARGELVDYLKYIREVLAA